MGGRQGDSASSRYQNSAGEGVDGGDGGRDGGDGGGGDDHDHDDDHDVPSCSYEMFPSYKE